MLYVSFLSRSMKSKEDDMAKIWRNRIEAGDQLFENCPDRYKPQVLVLMRKDVVDGVITKEQFEALTGQPYEA